MKEKIEKFFNELRSDTMHTVDEFYAENIHFEDPLGEIRGRSAMRAYYEKLYRNVIDIRFDFKNILADGSSYFAPWTMEFRSKALKKGSPISVEGGSLIRFNSQNQAEFHRDYFDMGAFIYEHIPVLRASVAFVKNRLKH